MPARRAGETIVGAMSALTAPPERGPVTDLGRLLFGVVIVTVGALYLLDAADVLDAGRAIDHGWPAVFVAAGLLTLLERPPSVVRGLVFVAGGTIGLLFTAHVIGHDAWRYIWPALVVLVGLGVIARWRGATIPRSVREDDVVRATGVFGGPKVASSSQALRGAWLTAVFGGVELDLRSARPAPEGAAINATAAFGGIDILVPKGWRLTVRTTPIFGGVEDKTDHSEPPPDDAPTLRIDAVCIFGGIGIKHER